MRDFLSKSTSWKDTVQSPKASFKEGKGSSKPEKEKGKLANEEGTFTSWEKKLLGGANEGASKRASSGGWSISMLTAGIVLCCVGAVMLSIQLQSRKGMTEDCIRTADAFQFELSNLQEQVSTAKDSSDTIQTDTLALKDQLERAKVRQARLDNIYTVLKTEQQKLEDRFKRLQADKQTMLESIQANKVETKQVDTLAKQLEQMLNNMHVQTGTLGGVPKATSSKPAP